MGLAVLHFSKYHTSLEQKAIDKKLKALPLEDQCYFRLLRETGCRASEGLGITKADLNPEDCTVYIKALKGSNDRITPIKPDLFKAIYDLACANPDSKPFQYGYSRMQKLWYKVSDKKLHALRHDFAIELYQKSRDLQLVKFALGHRSIDNTLIYAQLVDGNTRLREFLL